MANKSNKTKVNKIKRRLIKEDNYFSLFEVLIIILISILFGILVGYIITISKSPISNTKKDSNLLEIINVYENIVNNYYKKVDKNKISDSAIKGMLESLEDPFTNYMDSSLSSEFNEAVEGSFVGIGIIISYENDLYTINEVIKNSPADKKGLKKGDILKRINNKEVDSEFNFSKELSRKAGDKVSVVIERDGKEKKYNLKSSVIELENVLGKTIEYDNENIGYVQIKSFSSNSYKQYNRIMKQLKKDKIKALILDVRSNPGGHLKQTREILNSFFSRDTILYQVQVKNKKEKVYAFDNTKKTYPVAVLIDSGSASAAEIVASCFKENYKKSIIIGENSYGKGTVQQSQNLKSGNTIKYTTQKWLTSKGKWLDKKGVKPDVIVAQSEKYLVNPTQSNDEQLKEALKLLKESIK